MDIHIIILITWDVPPINTPCGYMLKNREFIPFGNTQCMVKW